VFEKRFSQRTDNDPEVSEHGLPEANTRCGGA
jgi:hypothetical protein